MGHMIGGSGLPVGPSVKIGNTGKTVKRKMRASRHFLPHFLLNRVVSARAMARVRARLTYSQEPGMAVHDRWEVTKTMQIRFIASWKHSQDSVQTSQPLD